MTDHETDAAFVERMDEPGHVTGFSSEPEECSSDVGLTVGLGDGRHLWFGEITEKRWREAGPEAAELGDHFGTWIILYGAKDTVVVGKALPHVADLVTWAISRAVALARLAVTQPAAAPDAGDAAIRDVLAERRRQVEEGWTPEHDDIHRGGQMALAASCYALRSREGCDPANGNAPAKWPWGRAMWKLDSPRRMLVKAGALILAEIERLDRAALRAGSGGK